MKTVSEIEPITVMGNFRGVQHSSSSNAQLKECEKKHGLVWEAGTQNLNLEKDLRASDKI